MLNDLKQAVCQANLELVRRGLVVDTFGNASGVDRSAGVLVIKPSGVPYEEMTPERMVAVDLASGQPPPGQLNPSSDTPTHLALYRALGTIGGIVHTHSIYATAWAQAGREIPPLGTTHGDFCRGPVPLTRALLVEEIAGQYEANTGKVIVERLAGQDPLSVPGVLVSSHGPFAWGRSCLQAVANAAMLEHLAHLAALTVAIEPYPRPVSQELLDKHFLRKHGPGAYYGQANKTGD